MKTITRFIYFGFAPLALACFMLSQTAWAVVPAPDGGYPGANTAEGQKALFSLTSGGFNTAVGWLSLETNSTGQFNTGVGAGTLALNNADENTATGTGALLFNSTGDHNTANGAFALFSNTTGHFNMANGDEALFSNTVGSENTACDSQALTSNTTGNDNVAVGFQALLNNTIGGSNTALGADAGSNSTTGFGNVYIGAGMTGVAGESNACYIASIFNSTSTGGTQVFINSANQLGTATSSKRFKEEIKPMDKASEALFSLKPVSFRYKKQIDPAGTSQFGLVAEDVEKVNPDLVVRDKVGKPYSVRYDQVNAMLLNEFLKEHKAFVEEQRKVQDLEKQVEKLTAGLQKVSAQLELNKPAPRTARNTD